MHPGTWVTFRSYDVRWFADAFVTGWTNDYERCAMSFIMLWEINSGIIIHFFSWIEFSGQWTFVNISKLVQCPLKVISLNIIGLIPSVYICLVICLPSHLSFVWVPNICFMLSFSPTFVSPGEASHFAFCLSLTFQIRYFRRICFFLSLFETLWFVHFLLLPIFRKYSNKDMTTLKPSIDRAATVAALI